MTTSLVIGSVCWVQLAILLLRKQGCMYIYTEFPSVSQQAAAGAVRLIMPTCALLRQAVLLALARRGYMNPPHAKHGLAGLKQT